MYVNVTSFQRIYFEVQSTKILDNHFQLFCLFLAKGNTWRPTEKGGRIPEQRADKKSRKEFVHKHIRKRHLQCEYVLQSC